jgi:tRNA 2-thiouridine synthesizing protein A
VHKSSWITKPVVGTRASKVAISSIGYTSRPSVDNALAPEGDFIDTSVVDVEVDARDLRCPMPLLKAKQAIQHMQAGQLLRVMATDPGSVRDFQAWSAQSGHCLLSLAEQNNHFIYVLRKSS